MEYTVFVPSHRPYLAHKSQKAMLPVPSTLYDGTGAKSFSWLVNHCVAASPTETVVICADKAYPSAEQVARMVGLIEQGYGLVAMYRFAFFGFRKELMRRIGFFDERYVFGCWEDNDMALRLREADVAYYESHEVPYQSMPCSWPSWSAAERHYKAKWTPVVRDGYRDFVRRLPEERYDYDLGPATGVGFLPWEKSQIYCGFYIQIQDVVSSSAGETS